MRNSDDICPEAGIEYAPVCLDRKLGGQRETRVEPEKLFSPVEMKRMEQKFVCAVQNS